MYKVRFISECNEFQDIIIKDVPPGYSIAEVAVESDINLHHNCGMVCSCSSCHVYVEKGAEFLEEKSCREIDFLERARNPENNSRLGCQSMLLIGSGYIEIKIPNQAVLGD